MSSDGRVTSSETANVDETPPSQRNPTTATASWMAAWRLSRIAWAARSAPSTTTTTPQSTEVAGGPAARVVGAVSTRSTHTAGVAVADSRSGRYGWTRPGRTTSKAAARAARAWVAMSIAADPETCPVGPQQRVDGGQRIGGDVAGDDGEVVRCGRRRVLRPVQLDDGEDVGGEDRGRHRRRQRDVGVEMVVDRLTGDVDVAAHPVGIHVAGLQTQDVQGGGGDGVDIPPRRLIGWQRVGVAHSRLPLGRGLWVAAAFGDDDADDVRVDDRDVEDLPVRVRLRGDLALFGLRGRGRLNGGLRLVDGVGHGVLVILTMPPAATTRAEK